MFLTHPQQTKDNFKENIKNLLDDCLNSRNKINPHQLPEILLAGDAAWLIVCSQHQETVIIDNGKTFKYIAKEAARIHRRIQSRYYQEFKGIEQVDVALDFEGTTHLNFTLTKEAFLEYLNSNDKYRQLLANAHISSGTTPENSTQQIFVQMIQNNIDLALSKTEISNIDARIFHTENSYNEAPKQPSELPTAYLGDDINIAVVTIILPKLLPNKKTTLTKKILNKLCHDIFNQLADVLNTNGSKVTDNLPQNNKKDGKIAGKDKNDNPISLSYEALEKRVKSRLIHAYHQDLKSKIHNI